MTLTTQAGLGQTQLETTASDYTPCYYSSHLGSDEDYSWDSPGWRAFFTMVANKVISLTDAKSVLDVGCARGLLVQALVEAGIDAHGTDISQTAVVSAHPDVRDRLVVATAAEPLEGIWDLITCIEVVEHMSPVEADSAIAHMCAVTERVFFSSGPSDYGEPTHVNVRPPADWAAAFAEHGFFRRTDVDLSFLTPWAVLFERVNLDIRAVVHRYEAYAYPMRVEVLEKRAALLEAHRATSALHSTSLVKSPAELAGEVADLKHRLLTSRDHAIGAEATAAWATSALLKGQAELAGLRDASQELIAAKQEIQDLRSSQRWLVGGWVARPASLLKRLAGR
jgi:SAM-dependent methyltransferase